MLVMPYSLLKLDSPTQQVDLDLNASTFFSSLFFEITIPEIHVLVRAMQLLRDSRRLARKCKCFSPSSDLSFLSA